MSSDELGPSNRPKRLGSPEKSLVEILRAEARRRKELSELEEQNLKRSGALTREGIVRKSTRRGT